MADEPPAAPAFWTPEQAAATAQAKLVAPAAQRNREPILSVLADVLPATGTVLEIASGSGEHAVHVARTWPALRIQPTDPSEEALGSIAAWRAESGLANLLPPVRLDVHEQPWPVESADAILCINMIHIAPWSATEALFGGAAALLSPGAPLYLYGPFRRPGRPLEPGNAAFDQSLRARDPGWGLRNLADVERVAKAAGFDLAKVIEMPANNLSLVFRRS